MADKRTGHIAQKAHQAPADATLATQYGDTYLAKAHYLLTEPPDAALGRSDQATNRMLPFLYPN